MVNKLFKVNVRLNRICIRIYKFLSTKLKSKVDDFTIYIRLQIRCLKNSKYFATQNFLAFLNELSCFVYNIHFIHKINEFCYLSFT